MVHNFSSDIKGKDGPLLPGGVRDDEIISMAVGDVIDDDDDEESMEAWISLHQSWWESNDLIMFLSGSRNVHCSVCWRLGEP